jgi:hypothetical protein
VNGFQAIPDVGKRSLNDHAHRVVEERLLHLVLDETRDDVVSLVGHGAFGSGVIR